MDPGTAALVIGGTSVATSVLGASISSRQAQQQNEAILARRRQQDINRAQAIQVGQQQAVDAGDVEQQKLAAQADSLRSRIRVAAGESGIGLGGTFEALTRQVDIEEAFGRNVTEQNVLSQIGRIRSGAPAAPSLLNPQLAALSGGLSGLQSGLSIGSTVVQIARLAEAGTG